MVGVPGSLNPSIWLLGLNFPEPSWFFQGCSKSGLWQGTQEGGLVGETWERFTAREGSHGHSFLKDKLALLTAVAPCGRTDQAKHFAAWSFNHLKEEWLNDRQYGYMSFPVTFLDPNTLSGQGQKRAQAIHSTRVYYDQILSKDTQYECAFIKYVSESILPSIALLTV